MGFVSRSSTPTNVTPWLAVALATCIRAEDSARQGGHQEPQKLTTTTLPCIDFSENCSPLIVPPLRSGAALRLATE